MSSTNWTTVAESAFPWERDALDFVRGQFPSHEPYRAWVNFEFIADDGTINEVDLLVFTPQGFFLIEIKSRPGRLFGDAGTWTWETEGKLITADNPVLAANTKAKKLRALLQRQKACKRKGKVPFIDALVFCSAPDLRFELRDRAAQHVCLRDKESRSGILGAIRRRECPGLPAHPRDMYDRPTGKMVAQAMQQAGIRPSQRHRRVSDYLLEQIIGQGPGYQDWQAAHVALENLRRRVRIYNVRTGARDDERAMIERAARREAELLETLQHPGILRREGFTEHELGPALIYEHDPLSIRLDHFLAQRKDKLSADARMDLMRQIAEVIRFAHDKKVVHRGLCPQSILVTAVDSDRPCVKVFNWQVGYRQGTSTSGVSREVSATSHLDRLVEDASTAYMAPEAISDESAVGEHLDVFSLGAIAYHVFSGQAPAESGLDLSNKLRDTTGLQISSVINGAGEWLQLLVRESTNPIAADRPGTVLDFLDVLDEVQRERLAREHDYVEDPTRAEEGHVLPENFTVVKRLGRGGCSVALLVARDGHEFVLKAASSPDHNQRIKDEAEVLQKIRHSNIVEFCGTVEIGDRAAFLMRPVYSNKDERRIETLGRRLANEGRLHVDLLQRFGEDLLSVVLYLEEEGISHRDIKPDNIAIGQIKRGDKLHLVLFDFSLSRVPADNIRAGTGNYLDPLLPLRKPPRWDLHAERYAAAVTLYELATGPNNLPKWGDGASDPSHLDCDGAVDADLFEPSLRDSLTEFFTKAFRRDPKRRYDNAEEMRDAWRDCFVGVEQPGLLSDHEDTQELRQLLDQATWDTHIPELGLGTRAANALDRANIFTVEDLLTVPMRRLVRLRGVGNKTRREISAAVRILRERLESPLRDALTTVEPESVHQTDHVADNALSVDLLAARITRTSRHEGDTARQTRNTLLGLNPALTDPWPSQTDIAHCLAVTRGRIGQLVGKLQARWAKEPAVTRLREDMAGIIEASGGAMSARELADAILVARGSVQDEPQRTRLAMAVTRAAIEVERTMAEPRFLVRRDSDRIIVAATQETAAYAARLGDEADKLADDDPLAPPARVIARLREVRIPKESVPLSDARLVRLAAAASQHAAVSSRQELYTRGMDAARALKLSQGALFGVRLLTVNQIRDRVSSRYPEATRLPDRPALDDLLSAAGFDFQWDATAKGTGSYVSRSGESASITSGSESVSRSPTSADLQAVDEITPEIADARQFEERLERGIKEGAFLALMVNPKYYQRAADELCRRFPVKRIDFEEVFIEALRQVVEKANAKWEAVINTDAKPGEGNWDKLMVLVRRAMPIVEAQLVAADQTIVLVYYDLIFRYGQVPLLERLCDNVGRKGGIPGLWLLVSGDGQPMMEGKAVPIISPGQCVRVPESWLRNVHRGRAQDLTPRREGAKERADA